MGWALLAVAVLLVTGAGAALLVHRHHHDAPADSDFVAIARVPQQSFPPPAGAGASTGLFVSFCRGNENGHRNADNVIVSPGQAGGAHHLHEYVGNTSTDAFSTDASLAAAATTCRNSGRHC